MILCKTIRSRCFHPLHRIQSPAICQKNPLFIPSISLEFLVPLWRPFSLSSIFDRKLEEKRVEPLSVHFKRAVGLSDRRDKKSAIDAEDDSANGKLRERLRKLQEEVRCLNKKNCEEGTTPNPPSKNVEEIDANRSLLAIFEGSKIEEVKLVPYRVLSSDMQMLAHHLYLKGYLRDANFMPKDKFDSTLFETSYAREFLKFAAVEFAKDHSKTAKWLSASDLKKVALFGCPSADRRSAYASKFLRGFFEIIELEVCQKCTLKNSCKHAKKQLRQDCSNLNLPTVIKVLIVYALDLVPQELVVPKEVKTSVSRLLKEIVNLTQSGSSSLCRT